GPLADATPRAADCLTGTDLRPYGERNEQMRTTRIIVILIAALSVVLGLSSCNSEHKPSTGPVTGNPGATNNSRRIVFIFKVDGLQYGNACKHGTEQATKELPGVSVE